MFLFSLETKSCHQAQEENNLVLKNLFGREINTHIWIYLQQNSLRSWHSFNCCWCFKGSPVCPLPCLHPQRDLKATHSSLSDIPENPGQEITVSLHIHVHSSSIHNSPGVEATQLYIDGWVDKNVVCTKSGILFSLRKEGNPVTCYMDDLEDIVPSKINQS